MIFCHFSNSSTSYENQHVSLCVFNHVLYSLQNSQHNSIISLFTFLAEASFDSKRSNVTTSTEHPSKSAKSSSSPTTCKSVECSLKSATKSTSLSGLSSLRAHDPNTKILRALFFSAMRWISSFSCLNLSSWHIFHVLRAFSRFFRLSHQAAVPLP